MLGMKLNECFMLNVIRTVWPEEVRVQNEVEATQQAAEMLCRAITQAHEDKFTNDAFPYEAFNDMYLSDDVILHASDIEIFLTTVMVQTQMEFGCLYPALIYLQRLENKTEGTLRICKSNWRSLLSTALMISSKVWDDCSMVNGDFLCMYPNFTRTLARVNSLERIALATLSYDVNVQMWEYALYADPQISLYPAMSARKKPQSQLKTSSSTVDECDQYDNTLLVSSKGICKKNSEVNGVSDDYSTVSEISFDDSTGSAATISTYLSPTTHPRVRRHNNPVAGYHQSFLNSTVRYSNTFKKKTMIWIGGTVKMCLSVGRGRSADDIPRRLKNTKIHCM